jgi:hypothetical protein
MVLITPAQLVCKVVLFVVFIENSFNFNNCRVNNNLKYFTLALEIVIDIPNRYSAPFRNISYIRFVKPPVEKFNPGFS